MNRRVLAVGISQPVADTVSTLAMRIDKRLMFWSWTIKFKVLGFDSPHLTCVQHFTPPARQPGEMERRGQVYVIQVSHNLIRYYLWQSVVSAIRKI